VRNRFQALAFKCNLYRYDEVRAHLAATAAALAAEAEGRSAERRAADQSHAAAQAAIVQLKSEIGNLNERIARSESDAAEQNSARLKAEAANHALSAELAGERERARAGAEEAGRASAEAARRFNEYKEGADRRHVEISARCEEARASKEAAVRALEVGLYKL
jgi:predicted  nucleic acid-binding Zn-ribbon protein